MKRVAINPALRTLSGARHVLLLQGPVGPFFDRLATWLREGGTVVERIVFQAGDQKDCTVLRPIHFTGAPQAWPGFLAGLLQARRIDCIVLFGQCRYYHRKAIEAAAGLGIPVVVLEEGYFRPGFVTMELGGVNGFSTTLGKYMWQPGGAASQADPGGISPDTCKRHFGKMAWSAIRHYAAMHLHRPRFPAYMHHRSDDPWAYASWWVTSWLRKYLHRGRDRRLQHWLMNSGHRYFFVPLQHDGDAQIVHHSMYGQNANFVHHVMESFARHAPAGTLLVFRQHPHSRGGRGNVDQIRLLARTLGIGERVIHLVEGDTPDLCERSTGVVVINSTVGLQAIERGAPLKVLGEAMYDRAGLSFRGSLDEFWTKAGPPDPAAAPAFLLQLKNLTQAPASVYADRQDPLLWKRPVGESV